MAPVKKSPAAPKGLAAGGRALWREVTKNHVLRPDHARILQDACHECDLIDDLQAALKDVPRTTRGSMGQEVIHPLISELRAHRATLSTLLRGLSLADTDTSAVDASRAATVSAIGLARARWDRKA
jgi:hypothetical protein